MIGTTLKPIPGIESTRGEEGHLASSAQLEKARLVAKLRSARDRLRAEWGKVEGCKSHVEMRPEVVKEARRLRRRSPKTGRQRSLREIAEALARLGHVNSNRRLFSASSVTSMLEGQN